MFLGLFMIDAVSWLSGKLSARFLFTPWLQPGDPADKKQRTVLTVSFAATHFLASAFLPNFIRGANSDPLLA